MGGSLSSVIPALSRNPATARPRRERVFCDQGLDRAGCQLSLAWRLL